MMTYDQKQAVAEAKAKELEETLKRLDEIDAKEEEIRNQPGYWERAQKELDRLMAVNAKQGYSYVKHSPAVQAMIDQSEEEERIWTEKQEGKKNR
jgi:tetrahydromethanopterin S-methyltransferase subunit G